MIALLPPGKVSNDDTVMISAGVSAATCATEGGPDHPNSVTGLSNQRRFPGREETNRHYGGKDRFQARKDRNAEFPQNHIPAENPC